MVNSVDDIPAVCLEDDLVAILRLARSDIRFWRKFPDFIPFPPLPMLDRQIRVSGCVVAWFPRRSRATIIAASRRPSRS